MFATASNSIFRNVAGAFGTVVFAGVCLMGAVGPAKAAEAPPEALRSAVVQIADLNLASDAGQATLKHRIVAAAKVVCAGAGDDLRGKSQTADCIKTAKASAQPAQVASIN